MLRMRQTPRDYSLVARLFLRDLAFLKRWYRRTDDQALWFYAVISVTATLGSLLLLTCAVLLLLFGGAVPTSVHPATVAEEIVIAEFVAVYLIAWLMVEFSVHSLHGRANAATCFGTRSDTAKWWLTTLITVASVAAAMFLLLGKADSRAVNAVTSQWTGLRCAIVYPFMDTTIWGVVGVAEQQCRGTGHD
jgi:hypothetical protein